MPRTTESGSLGMLSTYIYHDTGKTRNSLIVRGCGKTVSSAPVNHLLDPHARPAFRPLVSRGLPEPAEPTTTAPGRHPQNCRYRIAAEQCQVRFRES